MQPLDKRSIIIHDSNRALQSNMPKTTTNTSSQHKPIERERPRSWWSTALSLGIHGTLIALLWSVPSLPINTPEVAPPESIDATILPPHPAEEQATEKPMETPPLATPTPAPTHTPAKPTATDNKPASAPSGTPKAVPASSTQCRQWHSGGRRASRWQRRQRHNCQCQRHRRNQKTPRRRTRGGGSVWRFSD